MTSDFVTGRQAPVIAGPGCLEKLPALRQQYNADSYLIVSDSGLAATGLVDALSATLGNDGPVAQFIAPAGEPTIVTVDTAASQVRRLTAPLVIGLGGGTALDIGKLVAALAKSPGPMQDYLLARNPWTGRVPSVMVPTTSGTGSEVTRTSILTDAEDRKLWAWGDELLPNAILLDPELTRSLPATITVATGLDAFVHALEATTGQARNRLIEAPALQSIRLVGESLVKAVAAPADLEARQTMQEAACLAGMAIDNGGTGIAHNIGHALGTLYHLPHGVAVALAVEASLPWSVAGSESIFTPAAHALSPGSQGHDLPSLFTALADAAQFNQALVPYCGIHMDAVELADVMQAEENAPMANNAARRPTASDWLPLAEATVATFNARRMACRMRKEVSA